MHSTFKELFAIRVSKDCYIQVKYPNEHSSKYIKQCYTIWIINKRKYAKEQYENFHFSSGAFEVFHMLVQGYQNGLPLK